MDNQKKDTLPEILINRWCFAFNAAIFLGIYLLVRGRLSYLGYGTEPANPIRMAYSNEQRNPDGCRGTTLTPAVVSEEPEELLHDSTLKRSLLYVIIAIMWITGWFLYAAYCCCYDVSVGEELEQRPIDEEGAVPSEPIDIIVKRHDLQNYLKWVEPAALPVAGPCVRDPQPSTSRGPTAEDIAADREAYHQAAMDLVEPAALPVAGPCVRDPQPSTSRGPTAEDIAADREAYHQAAMDLIEPVAKNISYLVTVYYTENQSLMLGKSTIIQDGGLWELCIQKQSVTAKDLETGHWLLTPSETDPAIVNRFLAHLVSCENSPPSLTIFIPVKLPADFVLQGDYTRPESIGFDIVVKFNDVYYANDLLEVTVTLPTNNDRRNDRPHAVRSSPRHFPRP